MKINTLFKVTAFGLVALLSAQADAKMVEYYEDAYIMQAPQELADRVAKIAASIGFDKDYQVIIPKKPGMQMNPWNKLVAYGINPQTKHPFLLINPAWFSTLNEDQQNFLIMRNLMFAAHGASSVPMKLFPWIWAIVILALMVLVFFALKRTRLGVQKTWVRILVTWALFAVANYAFLTNFYYKINTVLARNYDNQITQMTLEKIGKDKQVAISTFQAMDDFVKKELAEGDTFWKPFENTFADLVDRLK